MASDRIVAASAEAIDRAARLIRDGRLVAFPTETVYGLGANAHDDIAVARIFEAKKRPSFNPLIVHVDSVAALEAEAELPPRGRDLLARFAPGPLTLVLRRRAESRISKLASAGLDTIAIRLPAHPVARSLIAAAGVPIAAPSANRSGTLSPTRARHVLDSLDDAVDLIVDGGPCAIGLESTVLDVSGDTSRLLRAGGLSVEDIESAIGGELAGATVADTPRAPGQTLDHYAPRHPLRCDARDPRPDEVLVGFGPELPAGAATSLNLSPTGDLVEAASNLFALLHEADRLDVVGIAVMPIPERGLGRAINDRLRRAAAASHRDAGG